MTIRPPVLSPQLRLAGVAAQVLGSSMALLTAVAAAAPFVNVDWSSAKVAPSVVSPPLGSPRVLLTTGAPFAQLDWSPAKRPAPIAAPDQLHTDINRFTNPIPFVSTDRPMVWRIQPPAPPYPLPLNLALLNLNPIPFAQFAWPSTFGVRPPPPQPPPNNINLFSEVPFSRTDWSSTWRAPDFLPPAAQSVNIGLLAPVVGAPFAQFDWSPAKRPAPIAAPDQLHTDIGLFSNPIPFAQFAWPSTWRVSGFLPPTPQPVNIGLLAPVVGIPFAQLDWSPAKRPAPIAAPDQIHADISCFTNPIPFAQYGWPSTFGIRPPPPQPPPNNVNIFSEVPFSRTDWSSTRRVSGFLRAPQPYNLALLQGSVAQAPFSQIDWSKPRSAPAAAPAHVAYNVALYGSVAAAPFVPIDWSRSFFPKTSVPIGRNVALLITAPAPSGPRLVSIHGAIEITPLAPGAPAPSISAIDGSVVTHPDAARRLDVDASVDLGTLPSGSPASSIPAIDGSVVEQPDTTRRLNIHGAKEKD